MLFSILIPVYNNALTLNACLRSVSAQDWDGCEILLCDDGSSDGSLSVCETFQALYPGRVRVFSHTENRGLLLTRRDLFAAASGEYMLCVDADDELAPGALTALKEAVRRTGADMVVFDAVCVHTDGREEKMESGLEDGHLYAGADKAAVYEAVCTGRRLNSLCFKAFRRSILDLETDYEPWKGLEMGEDRFQSLPLLDRAGTVYCLRRPLYRYIKREGGITGQSRENFYEMRKPLWEREDRYFTSWNISTEYVAENCRQRCSEILRYLGRKQFTGSAKAFLREAGRVEQDGLFREYLSKTTLAPRYRRYGRLLLDGKHTLLFLALKAERPAAGALNKIRKLSGKER